ncbi:RNA 2',3'-cyclic phosphodiesterase [Kitasatospora sp. RB6PN24]|uniref:RNA 2',3'-cyclic phosphodiesterase n=1 Tax=Kitasatospora humi TaxID=2893891 RepID=UPI001E3C71A7|nr:RNA 2',3'-cyclic phosphodiesterase [Kitasatospora humi]MCC9306697.1 RNA 2',3'-cyclic phosphodiesterase [Kitasatospora humi]
MRLFVAVLPPSEVLAELDAAVAPLRELPGAERLRWTAAQGRHLTLAFLGAVDEEQLPALEDGLAQAVLGHPVHRLRLAGGGRFGDRVLWVGLAGETWALRGLARSVATVTGEVLEQEAPELGEALEYHPHLTLARTGRSGHHGAAERKALRAAAERLETFQGAEFTVASVHLMRSEFHGGPAQYTRVRSWALHEA